jgi:hypothetical protein
MSFSFHNSEQNVSIEHHSFVEFATQDLNVMEWPHLVYYVELVA